MKKILMLGGSSQQVPAIEKAKQLGYYTVLVDYLPDNPGQHVADKWYQESTTDIEAVYRIAVDEKVDGILPYASDPAALPAAIVAERLGLPSNPAEAVRILGVKHEFRKFLRQQGFPCPGTVVFNVTDDIDDVKDQVSQLRRPFVIKPTDSSGSKGVSFLDSSEGIEEAVANAARYSRNQVLIAEEFIERGFPDVIGGDIFVENGRIVLFGDMGCLRDDDGKSLIPTGEKRPNGLNPRQTKALHGELQRIVDKLGIRNGELNIEVLIDSNDVPHFLELGPRAGGNMIPIQLSDAFGIDLIEANVKAAMGEPVGLHPTEPSEAFMTFVLHSHEDGVFDGVEFSETIKPYLYRSVLYKKPGEAVEKFDGAGKALGILFFKFPDPGVMSAVQDMIDTHVQVRLRQSENPSKA